MIPYVDARLRAWASWRTIVRPRAGQGGYYHFRTVLGDLRAEGSAPGSTTSAGARNSASRTRAITRDWDDREPLECELVIHNLPLPLCTVTLLVYVGVPSLDAISSVTQVDAEGRPVRPAFERPHPLTVPQLEAALGVCRATVYNRMQAVHARILDELNEPRLDGLVDHVMRDAALDTLDALRQNRPHSAKVGITTAAA